MSAGWYRVDPASGGVLVEVHVQPNAKTSGFAGLHGEALKVRIAAPAVDDKANAALLELLGSALGLPLRAVTLRRGHRGRRKTVALDCDDPALAARLEALASA